MKKSTSLLFAAALLFISVFSSCSEDSSPAIDPGTLTSSPNIVFLIADDLGWDVFGNYPGLGGTKASTPTLDSLAKNGITFTNFWANPVCAPTRASMLTGKYAFRNGVGGVQTPQTAALQSSETILQKYINNKTSNGYATALIGKWHVSKSDQLSAPENFGIGYYSGIFLGAVPDYSDWTQTSGGSQQKITTYSTTHFVNQSVSWIQQQSKPFFLWLAFNAPHTPFHRPPTSLLNNKNLADNQAAINSDPYPYYLASIEAMDKEIGRLIASLTAEQKENTVFVFMGDNGTPKQVAQAYSATGTKNTLYQGGINVPLLVCGKNVSRKNVTETALVQAPDMFATLAEIAGAGSENYQDAISFKALLTNAGATKRTFVYSEQFGNTSAIYDGYALRNADYKLIHLENGTEYFYKLSTDPFEEKNLFSGSLSAEAQQNLDQLRAIKAGL